MAAINFPSSPTNGQTHSENNKLWVYNTALTSWLAASASYVFEIPFIIDGGDSVITTGIKGYLEIPFNCTISQVTLLADVAGSIVIDIWKDTYANYPPLVGDSICASAKPTLSCAIKSQDATLTGWTKNLSTGDVLGFNVDSVATVKLVTISIKVTR